MNFLKMQVLRFERYEARNSAFDLTRTTERGKMLAQALKSNAALMEQDQLLDYAYNQRLDGIIITDAQKKIVAEYHSKKYRCDEVYERLQTNYLDDILQYPLKEYMDEFICKDKPDKYSYAVVARQDAPGFIVTYTRQSNRAEADSESYMDGLFNSYGFELDGTVLVTDGKLVLSSNRQELKHRKLDELMPHAREKLQVESDGLYSIEHDGDIYYGVVEQYKNYRLAAFFPAKTVFEDRTRNMAFVLIFYVLVWMLFLYLHFRFSQERELAYQEKLKKIAIEAQKASIAKTDFLRRMSHDIRTPLNGILGLLEMAEYYPLDEEKHKEYRAKILENTHYLLDLSNDVLEMNKIESGEIHLAEKNFDLEELAKNIGTMTEAQAKLRNITCKRDYAAEQRYVIGSPVHVRQILSNLTSNAVKYNKEGGEIMLATREVRREDDTVWMEFTCADTGIGMSDEFKKHAFEVFAQEHAEARTSYLGTGLGLAIVKRLTELMGGELTFDSTKGEGTTFKITLPFKLGHKPCAQKHAAEVGKVSLKGLKVLVVEDNALNMKIEEFLLEREGAVLTKAFNGQEAVNIFAESEPGDFDVILMDIMMPVMDGLTATRTIRALHHLDAATIPIIALSANAFAEDKEECRKAGFTGHLAKPLEAEKLLAMLRQFVHSEA